MELQRVDGDLLGRGRDLPPPPQTKPNEGGSTGRVKVPPRFRDATFETFDLKRNPKMEAAYKAALAMARGEGTDLLFLYGPSGLGKTHLACAVVKAHPAALFWDVPEFLAWLRSQFGKELGAEQVELTITGFIKNADMLLVLDDLGAHNPTAWAEEQLYRILNGRYNNEAPTIITANVDIDRIDPRIRSRFRSGKVICEGVDQR